ncbi:MAG: Trm112 family protein [Planctomycetes bacterium]|nr:Trm112 family protein [Planctomycetota bacterium]
MLDEELLKILACPKTRAPLIEIDGWLYSTDPETRLRYPIRDGIPIMLIEEAETVDVDEFRRLVEAAAAQ